MAVSESDLLDGDGEENMEADGKKFGVGWD